MASTQKTRVARFDRAIQKMQRAQTVLDVATTEALKAQDILIGQTDYSRQNSEWKTLCDGRGYDRSAMPRDFLA